MKNPFNPQNLGEAHLKRNVFDLGRNSIFTNDFFKLYPFFCQEILPGDTARIDAQIGVRGMPTVFPVQTRCRISMEFYYVRNRTLMDNFEDYIFMTKDIEAPWLRLNNVRAKQMISVGSLGDAFNIPSTVGTSVPLSSKLVLNNRSYRAYLKRQAPYFANRATVIDEFIRYRKQGLPITSDSEPSDFNDNLCMGYPITNFGVLGDVYNIVLSNELQYTDPEICDFFFVLLNSEYVPVSTPFYCKGIQPVLTKTGFSYDLNFDGLADYLNPLISSVEGGVLLFGSSCFRDSLETQTFNKLRSVTPIFPVNQASATSFELTFNSVAEGIYDATSDVFINSNPFVGDNPDIRLNALPWRAYEMCCNYYYRNEKNNPYVLNGESQYNEFIPTHASGPDDNVYDYHYRNWELDRFTSAIQSPQFGEAPLVGLTYSPTSPTADLTFQASLDGGETKDYTVKVGVTDNGDIDSIVDFDSDVPSANLQRLQRQIQAGISINDLRVTNSFQRFLENTIRRGLRYRNQLKSHFGVSVDYPDIDVPQYIGGASGFLESGQVTNTADSPNAGLGDYVGTLQGGISLRNKITHYCPEHGFIIGIFSIAPIPNYPQSISKVMIKTNPLDYYLPEFGKIGYVPIHYSELMPLQTPSDGSVDDVFGYQRAHYDYMQAFDEVHGDFRTNLSPFVLSRTFKERPLLSSSFTVGSPDQLNDIWVANNIADAYQSTAKFMCSSHVSCIMKREVAMIGTPSLE